MNHDWGYKLWIGNNRVKFKDCRQSGHSAFSRPQPTIQLQQNKCPHSVAQLSVRSSRHNVQFLLALIAEEIDTTSKIVRSSSSAGLAGSLSGSTGPRKEDIGRSSIYVSVGGGEVMGCLPFDLSKEGFAKLRTNDIRRYKRRMARSIPSREYDGARVCGSSGSDDS
jgi:hypothetical protein